jgi:hypothetical protein
MNDCFGEVNLRAGASPAPTLDRESLGQGLPLLLLRKRPRLMEIFFRA